MKKILLADPRGFCFGVERALGIVQKALDEKRKPLYVFNEIVHNKMIVGQLAAQGVTFTQDADSIPKGATVIISAHGISPQIRTKLSSHGLVIMDATCPLVEKVHAEAVDYGSRGYHIIYIGNKKHEEAIGVLGEAPGNVSVVETESDIDHIVPGKARYVVLTQTTLNIFETERLFERIKGRIPRVEFPDKKDLCRATTDRQLSVRALAKKVDMILILGSLNSSNSKKLREVANTEGVRAYLIDSKDDIDPSWLSGIDTLGISSGASAPEYLVEQTIERLIKDHGFTL